MIDWARVEDLRTATGEADFCEIVDLFLEEVEEALAALVDHGGAEDLRERLHFLKGSALNLGFADLSEMCAEGETTGRADIPGIRACFDRCRREFFAGVGHLDGA